jgi:UDP-N-acetylmuramoyl-tripeptide--D-alanyl-D-alanine ligase
MARDRLTEATSHEEIAAQVHSLMAAGDWLLVKGSRGMRMEKVVEALIKLRSGSAETATGER